MIPFFRKTPPPDLTVCGFVLMADGWGKIAVEILKTLYGQVSLSFASTRSIKQFANVPSEIQNVIQTKKPKGRVLLYADCVWSQWWNFRLSRLTANSEQIRIAYSMFESTRIPPFWVPLLHKHFDAIAVPDSHLVEVYRNSGVQLPIFTLPLCVDYDEFLTKPLKAKRNSPMVFADFSVFAERKNHLTLLRAFAKAFGNSSDVRLLLNGRYGQGDCYTILCQEILKLGLTNVILTQENLPRSAYIDLFQTVDCYVVLSKGEGYSIPPREAMAQGIPVICTDNSALRTLCQSGLVRAVPSRIEEPAYSHWPKKQCYGTNFNCTIEMAAAALTEVRENYNTYLAKAEAARKYIIDSDYRALAPLYQTLVKPQKILLGSENRIIENSLITNSSKLFNKYNKFCNCFNVSPKIK